MTVEQLREALRKVQSREANAIWDSLEGGSWEPMCALCGQQLRDGKLTRIICLPGGKCLPVHGVCAEELN